MLDLHTSEGKESDLISNNEALRIAGVEIVKNSSNVIY